MPKKKLAIIGSGIAGLGCAHFLHSEFEVTILEKRDRIGGHVNSVVVDDGGEQIAIDTGFMVYNRETYPNFTRLLDKLDVKTKPTDMSFSVQHKPCDLEWSGTGFKRLFARKQNLTRLEFWKLLLAIDKFNREARTFLLSDQLESLTIEEFVDSTSVEKVVMDLYILPMMSSLWSAPPGAMRDFPAPLFLKFMHSHGLLSVYGKLDWSTIDGGANNYVEELVKPFKQCVHLNSGVERVSETAEGVAIETLNGERFEFDKCIMACHANQAHRMLAEQNKAEKDVLSNFSYQQNTAVLHKDESVMPLHRGNWASWNYRIIDDSTLGLHSSTHYWMNSLQDVSQKNNYFVTIDSSAAIAPDLVVKEIKYQHPVFTTSSLSAQTKLRDLNTDSNERKLFFCGSYFKYGFHEDAFASACELSSHLLGRNVWN